MSNPSKYSFIRHYSTSTDKFSSLYYCIVLHDLCLTIAGEAIAPMLGIKRMTGFAHFDMVSAVANASFLIFQILIGAFVIWRLLILLGGSGTYRGVMCNYIYGLAYTNALRTVVIVFVHILGLILFAISQQKYVADIAYLVTMFSQYYAVFICAQLMRRYLGLGIVKTYIVMFIVALLSVSVLPQWIRVFHTLVK